MDLRLVADAGTVVVLDCHGDVRHEAPGPNPLETLLGPGVYARRVVLGMRRVRFIDSSGVGWLVVSHRRFQKAGGRFVLHSLPSTVLQTLQFVHAHAFVTVAGTEAEARALAAADAPPAPA